MTQEISDSYDELPLWSAPFGLMLLDTIRLRKGMRVLDVGTGHGFPMLEIADRMGSSGQITGLDPAHDAIEVTSAKIKKRAISNADIIKGHAEEMPFRDDQFDLVTSNNGLNNVRDQAQAFLECYRVAKPGAQMVITMNLPHTMTEFYEILEEVLLKKGLGDSVIQMHEHISEKRKPVEYLKELILSAGFSITSINLDGFKYRFTGAEAVFHHFLIRNYFLPSWEALMPASLKNQVMQEISEKIDRQSEQDGLFTLMIPYVCFDCQKPLPS